jgi:hypothetical protein
LGDASRWTPHIVAAIVEAEAPTPRTALQIVKRSSTCSAEEWTKIETVKNNVNAIFNSCAVNAIATAFA